MKRMVLGFAFNPTDGTVLLMRKARPDWQAGKLNGVGGKLEMLTTGWESAADAIAREFLEETGCATPDFCWERVGVMETESFGPESWRVDIFMTQGCVWPDLDICKTDEPLEWVKVDTLTALAGQGQCLENIPVLVALCLLPPVLPSNRRPDFLLRY